VTKESVYFDNNNPTFEFYSLH